MRIVGLGTGNLRLHHTRVCERTNIIFFQCILKVVQWSPTLKKYPEGVYVPFEVNSINIAVGKIFKIM